MRRTGVFLALLTVASWAIFVSPAVGQPTVPSFAQTGALSQTAVEAVAVSQQRFQHIGIGLLAGLGVGILMSSVATFKYWESKL